VCNNHRPILNYDRRLTLLPLLTIVHLKPKTYTHAENGIFLGLLLVIVSPSTKHSQAEKPFRIVKHKKLMHVDAIKPI